jgi:uncharacterized protein (DUF433 family)
MCEGAILEARNHDAHRRRGWRVVDAKTTGSHTLIERLIEPNPHKPGPAEWRIRGTGLPVWRVVGQFAVELGTEDSTGYREIVAGAVSLRLLKTVAAYYDMDSEAIRAALAYASQHQEPVIARLVLDRAALSR